MRSREASLQGKGGASLQGQPSSGTEASLGSSSEAWRSHMFTHGPSLSPGAAGHPAARGCGFGVGFGFFWLRSLRAHRGVITSRG